MQNKQVGENPEKLRLYLEKNAINKMKTDVNASMDKFNEDGEALNSNITAVLKDKQNRAITLENTANIDLKLFNSLRLDLNKENYHFPDVLYMGELISLMTAPSNIYPENRFVRRIPFLIPTQQNGVAFLTNSKYKDVILGELESTVINLMSALPDGLVKLTLIDKTGSGQNFNALNRFSEKFVSGRVLSEDSEIEEELSTIKNSMGTVSQAITANGFQSVEDYNNNTDEIPQRYNFIVINDFPTGFNKKATENLFALIESGYKSGIYVFMTSKYDAISGFNKDVNGNSLNSFLSLMTTFQYSDRTHTYKREGLIPRNVEMVKSPIIQEEEFKSMTNSSFKIKLKEESTESLDIKVSALNQGIENISLKPMVKLSRLFPKKSDWYSKSANLGISVPFGKVGIENTFLNLGVNQYDEIENVHHGLLCGMTGSGKTVLIHNLILMSSMLYSPDELQFYLLDYKEGTEFALYQDFPQVNILSMESEIEFGHEVLEKAILEIQRRGTLFKSNGVSNLNGYNSSVSKADRLPRIVILIDEFQELFPKDKDITSKSNALFDTILRLGRSFGINLLVATQTLLGVNLEPQLFSNMPLRIGLTMTESDANIVFGENNLAAKYLSDPGQGIYNASHGIAKKNIPFQAANVDSSEVKDIISELNSFMGENLPTESMEKLLKSRFVYSGDKAGSIQNAPLTQDKVFIGEPVGLKQTHETISFNREFGDNLLLLGENQVQAVSTVINIVRQVSDCDVYFINFAVSLNSIFKGEFGGLKHVHQTNSSDSVLKTLSRVSEELNTRIESQDRSRKQIILSLNVIEGAKFLNHKGESPERTIFEELLLSGSEYGIHVMVYGLDYSTLSSQNIINDLSKFKKKIVFNGGDSDKILSKSLNASKSEHVASFEFGNKKSTKFKPYILDSVKTELLNGGN